MRAFELAIMIGLLLITAAIEAKPTNNATAEKLLKTVMSSPSGGIAQLGGPVEITCRVINHVDVLMIKLVKLPLNAEDSAAAGQEVFTAGGGKQKLRSPWDTRPDLVFNGSSLTVRFNMSQLDEGRFRCDAVTLDGELPGNAQQLLTLQPPSAPGLLFDGAAPKPGDHLEVVIGDILTVNCSANVGKPAGDIRITFAPATQGAPEKEVPGATNASWTGPISAGNHTVFTIFKSSLVKVKIEDSHHGGCFACRLTPSALAASLTADVNGTADTTAAAGNWTSQLVARGPAIHALFPVSNIRMEPFRENFFHGDYLDCLADGRPEPDIRWTQIQGAGSLQVNGSRLSMPTGAKPGYYSYTCSATNSVRGRSHQLLQSIGFNLHNRTAADTPKPDGASVTGRVKTWVTHHRHGVTIALAVVGVLASLALLGSLLLCFCGSSGYRRLSGAKSSHHSVRDRMRYYGELGETVIESSDEEDDGYHLGGSRQLLGGKQHHQSEAENGGSEWNGTQV
ncbi:hypothetical protein BOX15_Mlig031132g1 [Macrostomum lignano]|uniref:Ig-like domain-containing protein n=1 Tax=Macrostomum lignano TaxID=282301 RepID=A0A267GTS7_9PLAT|nr:hypothetical protein BOX15_Mlig031132g1 [Macrostomum lignano]